MYLLLLLRCMQVAELPREDVVRLLRTELLADLDLGEHQCQQLLDAIGLDGCASLTIGQIRQALLKFMASSYSSDHEFDQDYDYPDMEARPGKGKQVAFAGLSSAGADSRDRETGEGGADAVVEVLPAGTAGGTMAQRTQSATSIYSQGAACQTDPILLVSMLVYIDAPGVVPTTSACIVAARC